LPSVKIGDRDMNFCFGSVMNQQGANKAKLTASCRWVLEPIYHATLVYSYSIPGVSGVRRKIRGWLDSFGVRFDPAVVWNATPFSFVVDWLVDIGGFLRSFSPTDLGMNIVILDASHSVKYHSIGSITGVLPHFNNQKYTEVNLWTDERYYYERAPWIPRMHSLTVSVPGAMQYSLAGALAISGNKQRFKRG